MAAKVMLLALYGGPFERPTPLGNEYERAARKALNPLIERAEKEGRLWGRWDDVLFYLDASPNDFYARFGVEWPRALAAVYEVLDLINEIEERRL